MKDIGNREIMANNLRYYIEKSGKSRSELAQIWGFPYTTISGWLSGEKYPRIDRIQIMADYFGIDITDLVGSQQKQPTVDDGLSENMRTLMDFVKNVPEDKAEMVLRVIQSIVESD